MTELRHIRAGEQVAFAAGNVEIIGRVIAFRLIPGAGGETQLLAIAGNDGAVYDKVDAANVRLIAGREAPAARRAVALPLAAIDAGEVARRGLSVRGATLLSVHEIQALSADYLALIDAYAQLEKQS